MKRISSRENPLVKKILKLKRTPEKFLPKIGRQEGEIIIEGPKVLVTALDAGVRIKSVAITEESIKTEKVRPLLDRLLNKEVPVNIIERDLMVKLSETVTPQGIIAIAETKHHLLEEITPEERVITVSDEIQDPGNIGTIIRILDAVGLRWFVVLKGSVSPFNPKAIRAAAGSHFHIRIVLAEKEEFIHWCHQHNISIVSTMADGKTDIFRWTPHPPLAIVFGNEASGISRTIKEASHQTIKVPIYGKAESLNVASASAVVLYELVRKIRQLSQDQP
jgi:TrmH family RNA methyltransferase